MARFTSCFSKVYKEHCTASFLQGHLFFNSICSSTCFFISSSEAQALFFLLNYNALLNTSSTSLLKTCSLDNIPFAWASPTIGFSKTQKIHKFLAIPFLNLLSTTRNYYRCSLSLSQFFLKSPSHLLSNTMSHFHQINVLILANFLKNV